MDDSGRLGFTSTWKHTKYHPIWSINLIIRGEKIPRHIYPIFRDEEELPANANLEESIAEALDKTRNLIVLCSPRSVASPYVAEEIDYFKKLGRSDRIVAVLIDGET